MVNYLSELYFTIFHYTGVYIRHCVCYFVQIEKEYTGNKNIDINYDEHLVVIRAMVTWVENLGINNYITQKLFTYVHDYFTVPALALMPVFIALMFLVFCLNTFTSILSSQFFTRLLVIAEQEFVNPRAIVLTLSLGLCLIIATLSSLFFGLDITILQALYLVSLSSILFLVVLIPINLIYNWGSYFPIYIKGQSIKKNIFIELITDYIHLLSFFLRINIQLIRLIIITCVFYMYNEMYIEFIYPTLTSNTSNTPIFGYIYVGASFILKTLANILYEVGHLWIMVGMQSGAFIMIIFVITQFLYSVYLIYRLQPFLVKLRSKKRF